jgi:hypothetical protein
MKTGVLLIGFKGVSKIGLVLIVSSISIRAGSPQPKVAICLDKGPNPTAIVQAQAIAQKMFSRIAVVTKWYSYYGSCPVDRERTIMIQMIPHIAEQQYPGAIAIAQPFEGIHIQVFWERVERIGDRSFVPRVLAHVLVHEIAHMISGLDSHADHGIMKATWDTEDYYKMQISQLAFTAEDVRLIHQGLSARTARKQGK